MRDLNYNQGARDSIQETLRELQDQERIGYAKLMMYPELAILAQQPAMLRLLKGLQDHEKKLMEGLATETPDLIGVAKKQGEIASLRLFTRMLHPISEQEIAEVKAELPGLTAQIQDLQNLLGHARLQPASQRGPRHEVEDRSG